MVLNSFMEEVKRHGDAPEDFKLYALNGGEALTNMSPWKNMLASHVDPAVARAWAEQGHVRFVDARKSPELLDDVAALHALDSRPLVIDTARAASLGCSSSATASTPSVRPAARPLGCTSGGCA